MTKEEIEWLKYFEKIVGRDNPLYLYTGGLCFTSPDNRIYQCPFPAFLIKALKSILIYTRSRKFNNFRADEDGIAFIVRLLIHENLHLALGVLGEDQQGAIGTEGFLGKEIAINLLGDYAINGCFNLRFLKI